MGNTCFLLGAGFTHAVTNGKAPLTSGLVPLIKNIITDDLQDTLNHVGDNIELFITLLDLEERYTVQNERRDKISECKKKVIDKIIDCYDIDKFTEHFPLCESFVKKVSDNACILTLNYDCLLDRYLYLSKRWSPHGGYFAQQFPSSIKHNSNLDNVLLLKLHGSCNFRNNSGNLDYPNIEVSSKIFPSIHAEINTRNYKRDEGAHVLIMSYLKQYHNGIMMLWREAIETLKNANRLTIIGCSLRDEDIFLRYALYHFGTKENTDKFVIEIVDKNKNSGETIKSKIEELVGFPEKQEYKIYNDLKEYLGD
ncbi:MAG: SIR2 family protein [Planctomycetes bacterium]|nr:SIR2 family protein [Planctomycetota bacterium]